MFFSFQTGDIRTYLNFFDSRLNQGCHSDRSEIKSTLPHKTTPRALLFGRIGVRKFETDSRLSTFNKDKR